MTINSGSYAGVDAEKPGLRIHGGSTPVGASVELRKCDASLQAGGRAKRWEGFETA